MVTNEIKTIIADIQASPKECEWVEIKQNNYNPQLIGEYISALSNGAAYMGQSKGYLVFGIKDDTHEIVGTDYNPQAEKIGNQELENWIATQLSPRIDFVIHNDIVISGKRVVLFVIDSAGNTPVKFRGTAYTRVGSYKKVLADHPEMERKIWQNTHNNCFETKIAKSGLNADEVLDLIDYASVFKLLRIPFPETKAAIMEKLAEEKIIHKRASCYDITNLGAILFATNLQNFDMLSRKAVRVIFYKGTNKLHALREQVGAKGYAIGFEGLVNYINERLPINEEIGKVLRKDNPIYPEIAIREFVANALIHQDFYMGGMSPMIEIYANRMEISNPGKPLIDVLRFIDHTPISRNELLASIMRRMSFCEERGSGVDRALYQCELYQLPAPDFIKDDFSTKVVMFAPQTLRQMNREDKIRACYQHCCLKYVAGEKMTNESLRGRLEISDTNYSIASRIISDTIAANLIRLDDKNKSRKYAQYVPIWS
jgi:predicted HTH transcriptional regulator